MNKFPCKKNFFLKQEFQVIFILFIVLLCVLLLFIVFNNKAFYNIMLNNKNCVREYFTKKFG